MDANWINVVDTAVKIGLGALISAVSGYLILLRNQSHEEEKESRSHFYKLQDEKKLKYIDLLAQSQDLIQSHLLIDGFADSEEFKKYLRSLNEVQVISNDHIRIAAHNLYQGVSAFVSIDKSARNTEKKDKLVKLARDNVAIFQKLAQEEVTKCYKKT